MQSLAIKESKGQQWREGNGAIQGIRGREVHWQRDKNGENGNNQGEERDRLDNKCSNREYEKDKN